MKTVVVSILAFVVLFGGVGGGGYLYVRSRREKQKQARVRIEETIKERVRTGTAETLQPSQVAKSLGLGWPLADPEKRVKEVEAEIREQVAKAVDAKLPHVGMLTKFREQARERFRYCRPGEKVTINVRDQKGGYPPVTGTLIAVAEDRVHIGNRWISRLDIVEEQWVHFDLDLSLQRIAAEVKANQDALLKKREAYRQQVHPGITRRLFDRAGYTFVEAGEQWRPKVEVVEEVREKRIQELTKRVEREEFAGHGYILRPEGGWDRKTLFELLRDKAEEGREPAVPERKDEAADKEASTKER